MALPVRPAPCAQPVVRDDINYRTLQHPQHAALYEENGDPARLPMAPVFICHRVAWASAFPLARHLRFRTSDWINAPRDARGIAEPQCPIGYERVDTNVHRHALSCLGGRMAGAHGYPEGGAVYSVADQLAGLTFMRVGPKGVEDGTTTCAAVADWDGVPVREHECVVRGDVALDDAPKRVCPIGVLSAECLAGLQRRAFHNVSCVHLWLAVRRYWVYNRLANHYVFFAGPDALAIDVPAMQPYIAVACGFAIHPERCEPGSAQHARLKRLACIAHRRDVALGVKHPEAPAPGDEDDATRDLPWAVALDIAAARDLTMRAFIAFASERLHLASQPHRVAGELRIALEYASRARGQRGVGGGGGGSRQKRRTVDLDAALAWLGAPPSQPLTTRAYPRVDDPGTWSTSARASKQFFEQMGAAQCGVPAVIQRLWYTLAPAPPGTGPAKCGIFNRHRMFIDRDRETGFANESLQLMPICPLIDLVFPLRAGRTRPTPAFMETPLTTPTGVVSRAPVRVSRAHLRDCMRRMWHELAAYMMTTSERTPMGSVLSRTAAGRDVRAADPPVAIRRCTVTARRAPARYPVQLASSQSRRPPAIEGPPAPPAAPTAPSRSRGRPALVVEPLARRHRALLSADAPPDGDASTPSVAMQSPPPVQSQPAASSTARARGRHATSKRRGRAGVSAPDNTSNRGDDGGDCGDDEETERIRVSSAFANGLDTQALPAGDDNDPAATPMPVQRTDAVGSLTADMATVVLMDAAADDYDPPVQMMPLFPSLGANLTVAVGGDDDADGDGPVSGGTVADGALTTEERLKVAGCTRHATVIHYGDTLRVGQSYLYPPNRDGCMRFAYERVRQGTVLVILAPGMYPRSADTTFAQLLCGNIYHPLNVPPVPLCNAWLRAGLCAEDGAPVLASSAADDGLLRTAGTRPVDGSAQIDIDADTSAAHAAVATGLLDVERLQLSGALMSDCAVPFDRAVAVTTAVRMAHTTFVDACAAESARQIHATGTLMAFLAPTDADSVAFAFAVGLRAGLSVATVWLLLLYYEWIDRTQPLWLNQTRAGGAARQAPIVTDDDDLPIVYGSAEAAADAAVHSGATTDARWCDCRHATPREPQVPHASREWSQAPPDWTGADGAVRVPLVPAGLGRTLPLTATIFPPSPAIVAALLRRVAVAWGRGLTPLCGTGTGGGGAHPSVSLSTSCSHRMERFIDSVLGEDANALRRFALSATDPVAFPVDASAQYGPEVATVARAVVDRYAVRNGTLRYVLQMRGATLLHNGEPVSLATVKSPVMPGSWRMVRPGQSTWSDCVDYQTKLAQMTPAFTVAKRQREAQAAHMAVVAAAVRPILLDAAQDDPVAIANALPVVAVTAQRAARPAAAVDGTPGGDPDADQLTFGSGYEVRVAGQPVSRRVLAQWVHQAVVVPTVHLVLWVFRPPSTPPVAQAAQKTRDGSIITTQTTWWRESSFPTLGEVAVYECGAAVQRDVNAMLAHIGTNQITDPAETARRLVEWASRDRLTGLAVIAAAACPPSATGRAWDAVLERVRMALAESAASSKRLSLEAVASAPGGTAERRALTGPREDTPSQPSYVQSPQQQLQQSQQRPSGAASAVFSIPVPMTPLHIDRSVSMGIDTERDATDWMRWAAAVCNGHGAPPAATGALARVRALDALMRALGYSVFDAPSPRPRPDVATIRCALRVAAAELGSAAPVPASADTYGPWCEHYEAASRVHVAMRALCGARLSPAAHAVLREAVAAELEPCVDTTEKGALALSQAIARVPRGQPVPRVAFRYPPLTATSMRTGTPQPRDSLVFGLLLLVESTWRDMGVLRLGPLDATHRSHVRPHVADTHLHGLVRVVDHLLETVAVPPSPPMPPVTAPQLPPPPPPPSPCVFQQAPELASVTTPVDTVRWNDTFALTSPGCAPFDDSLDTAAAADAVAYDPCACALSPSADQPPVATEMRVDADMLAFLRDLGVQDMA